MSTCATCGGRLVGILGETPNRCHDCADVEARLPAYLARKAAQERKTMAASARLRAWAKALPELPVLDAAGAVVPAALEKARAGLLGLVECAAEYMEAREARVQ